MPCSHHPSAPSFCREVQTLQQAIEVCWRDFDRQLHILADLTGRMTCQHNDLAEQLVNTHDTLYALRRQHGRALGRRLAALCDFDCLDSTSTISPHSNEFS